MRSLGTLTINGQALATEIQPSVILKPERQTMNQPKWRDAVKDHSVRFTRMRATTLGAMLLTQFIALPSMAATPEEKAVQAAQGASVKARLEVVHRAYANGSDCRGSLAICRSHRPDT